MNEHNEQFETLSPELAALDAGLAELGAAERAGAPSDLEGRIIAATSGVVAAHTTAPLKLTQPERTGVIARLSVKRLDWPMRVAAVIAVMIGGWAAFHGAGGPGSPGARSVPVPGSAEAERILSIWSTLENSGAAEKLQTLLRDAGELESLVGDGLGEPDIGDQENL